MQKKIQGVIVWLIATLYVAYAFCLNTASAVFSDAIQTSFDASNYEISLAFGAFILGFAVMQLPAGYMLDKFNARSVVCAGLGVMVLGNIAISSATSIYEFTTANLVLGSGASFAFISAAVLFSQWFSGKLFPILFGLMQSVSCIGAGFFHYYFTILLQTNSWNEIYVILAKFGAVLFFFAICFIKGAQRTHTKISLWKSLRSVLLNKQIVLSSLAAGMSFGVLLAYASLWYLKVQEYYDVNKLDSVMISGIIFLGVGIGTPFFAWYSNIMRSRVMVIHTTMVLGVIALMLGLYLPRFDIGSLMLIKIISFMIGFFLAGSLLFYTIVSESASNSNRGVAMSVLNTCVFIFNTALLFIPYWFITESSKEFFTYLWVLLFFPMLSILIVYFIKDSYPGRD